MEKQSFQDKCVPKPEFGNEGTAAVTAKSILLILPSSQFGGWLSLPLPGSPPPATILALRDFFAGLREEVLFLGQQRRFRSQVEITSGFVMLVPGQNNSVIGRDRRIL